MTMKFENFGLTHNSSLRLLKLCKLKFKYFKSSKVATGTDY